MMKTLLLKVAAVVLTAGILLNGCLGGPVTEPLPVAKVQRGDLEVKVSADGSIEMPAAVNLYFDTTMFTPPYSGRIKSVYVEKGDMVRAGTLLAKLDDTTQKLAVESSQYALELAMNNVVQTVCCGVTRSPGFYCDAVAFLRFEFAQKELEKARTLFQTGDYVDAATQISLAKYDLDGAKKFYSDPDYRRVRLDLIDVTQAAYSDYDIDLAIERLSSEIDNLSALQSLVKEGRYDNTVDGLQAMLTEMGDTYSVVKRLNHLPQNTNYPDTCTSYTVLSEALSSVDVLQEISRQKDFDGIRFAETLSTIRHDLELSEKILDENISTYRQGLNMKTQRDYNINVQNAIINLQRAKQSLLKTELLAPFDSKVVDVNLRGGDMITQRYLVTGVPIDSYVIQLANINSMRMTGLVDEIDIVKIASHPSKDITANILVDAFPGKEFKGKVTFISPFGPTQASGIQYYGTIQPTLSTYKVEIALDPQEAMYLTGGLTATAAILVDNRSNVLIIPNNAISGKDGDYRVRVLKDERSNLVEQRTVKIGLQNRSQAEVVSGLSEGEKVLLEKSISPVRPLRKQ